MTRVVLLLVDCMEASLVERCAAEGSLPFLASLLERGRSVRTMSPEPFFPARGVFNVVRGVAPSGHGVVNSRQLRPGTYRTENVDATAARLDPFWRYVSEAGGRTTVCSVEGAPFLEPFDGTQVIGWGGVDPYMAATRSRPMIGPPIVRRWLDDVAPRRRSGFLLKVPEGPAELRAYRDESLRSVDEQARALAMLLERTEWDLFVGAFDALHEAGHLLWGVEDKLLEELYAAVDRGLATVAERVPDDAILLVHSPSGMGPHNQVNFDADAFLRAGGWLAPARRPGARASALGAARTVARGLVPLGLRRRLGKRFTVARTRLEVASAAPDDDWASSRAFPIPCDGPAWYIRANLSGREPHGRVDAEAFEALCDEISVAASELVDENGVKAARDITRIDHLVGFPVDGALPDLVVLFDDEPVRTLTSPRIGRLELAYSDHRVGNHRDPGFVAGVGRAIAASGERRIGAGVVDLLDLAPTVLTLLGAPVPEHMKGTPIGQLRPEAQRST